MKKHTYLSKSFLIYLIIALPSVALCAKWYHKDTSKNNNDVYQSVVAEIRFGNELHVDELEYLKNRKTKRQAALQKNLKMSLENKNQPTKS